MPSIFGYCSGVKTNAPERRWCPFPAKRSVSAVRCVATHEITTHDRRRT
jgi:hypothetical protein